MSIIKLLVFICCASIVPIGKAAESSTAVSKTPVAIYTDIISGPNKGGENDKGIYLSIFGKNFGRSDLGKTIKVHIGGVEVDNYRYFGASKGRSDIQQISVQIGDLGNPKPGIELPIRVTVNGRRTLDPNRLVFTVNPGAIYFVDNIKGVDTNDVASGGTFAAPFSSVQKMTGSTLSFAIQPASISGAWGRVQAGDFIVMRGTGIPWTGRGYDNYFLRTLNKSGGPPGLAPTCAGCTGTGPITLMGYPGEDVFINGFYDPSVNGGGYGAISSADTARIAEGKGHWINMVGLRIEGGNIDGVVNTQKGGNNWRIVNNELTAASAVANRNAKAGGVTGNGAGPVRGPGTFILGNFIHDIYNGPDNSSSAFENHGVYLYGLGTYEIAYNRFWKIRGGNAIQTYANGTNNDFFIDNVNIHHNVIQDVGKHGINLADGTRNGIQVWNNVIYDIDRAGIRFNTTEVVNAQIFNNTIYNTNRINNGATAAVQSDANLRPSAVEFKNNIVWPVTGAYTRLNNGMPGVVTNNLWFEGRGSNPAITFSTNSLAANPSFVSITAGAENFRLQIISPAIDAGVATVSRLLSTDWDLDTLRPQGRGFDIGAYEFSR